MINQYASYCPEDNKLRLYVGRVPRAEYEILRSEGWTSTPKQECDFVATWTPERRDTALSYSDAILEDEDQDPQDRAADRAERFGGYRDKRGDEAIGHADRYDSQPSAHGFQNEKRAENSARRHDRIGTRATDQWDKAEYWTRRTSGVISNALYKSRPDVRMGRIKTLESDLRKLLKFKQEWLEKWKCWKMLSEIIDPVEKSTKIKNWVNQSGSSSYDIQHPRPETVTNRSVLENGSYFYTLMTMTKTGYGTSDMTADEVCEHFFKKYPDEPSTESEWSRHCELRLAYENQMLEAQGGRAASVEMIAGGFLRGGRHLGDEERQIQKVNKSPKTGRVVSVLVRDNHPSSVNQWGNPWPDGVARVLLHTVKTERLSLDAYREPSCQDLADFHAQIAKEKIKEDVTSLINPTDEDAQRLQDLWNDEIKKRNTNLLKKGNSYVPDYVPAEIAKVTQARYSMAAKGSYSRVKTVEIGEGTALCKVRSADGCGYNARRVIIITDKPQKPLSSSLWKEEFTLELI